MYNSVKLNLKLNIEISCNLVALKYYTNNAKCKENKCKKCVITLTTSLERACAERES